MRDLVLAIFGVTYLLLAMGRVPRFRFGRTGISIIGAAAMILSGALSLQAAAETVDYRTLVLLFGMMIVVANLRLSGFFRLVTARAIHRLTVAASSTLAGNLTPLASVANLIVIEPARRAGVEISFRTHLRLGVPLTLLTLIVAVVMLGFAA